MTRYTTLWLTTWGSLKWSGLRCPRTHCFSISQLVADKKSKPMLKSKTVIWLSFIRNRKTASYESARRWLWYRSKTTTQIKGRSSWWNWLTATATSSPRQGHRRSNTSNNKWWRNSKWCLRLKKRSKIRSTWVLAPSPTKRLNGKINQFRECRQWSRSVVEVAAKRRRSR